MAKQKKRVLSNIGQKTSHILLLGIRIYFGWFLFQLGKARLVGLVNHVETASVHQFVFYLKGLAEAYFGISFALGLYTRFSAFIILLLYAVDYSLHYMLYTPLWMAAYPIVLLYVSCLLFCFGSGVVSCDYFLEKQNS